MNLDWLKSLVRMLEHSTKASNWFFLVIALILILSPKESGKRSRNYLLPHPGNGNIGDEAMLHSVLNFLGGDCTLLVENKTKFKHLNHLSEEIEIVEIPHLIYGNFLQSLIGLYHFARISPTIRTFSMIGADVMDGHYNCRASINRLLLLRALNFLNIDSRVTGFSWSQNAKPVTLPLLRRISDSTKLYVRDPESAMRLRMNGVNSIVEVSDLAFYDQTLENLPDVDIWVSKSVKPIVLVNISGLGLKDRHSFTNHVNEYVNIIKFLHSRGYRILLVPHVFRNVDGDLEVSDFLFKEACSSEDYFIREPFIPAQERYLLRNITFVITGRMHVAVIALSVGKPAIGIETMGKVKGLFDLFDLGAYCVANGEGFGINVATKVRHLEREYSKVCALINNSLPEVRRKSALNFTGFSQMENKGLVNE